MIPWTSEELNKIGNAEEIQISSLRSDGTLRKPVIIWLVRVAENLYIRSANGRTGTWFRGIQTKYEGQIQAGAVEKNVSFVEELDPQVNDLIDAAYLAKYHRYPQYVSPMLTPSVRAATLKLIPRT
ncbi:MAG: DUF2255 family protein [Chloroflexota bacterium]